MDNSIFEIYDSVLKHMNTQGSQFPREIAITIETEEPTAKEILESLVEDGNVKKVEVLKREGDVRFGYTEAWKITFKGRVLVLSGGYLGQAKEQKAIQSFRHLVSLATMTIAVVAVLTFLINYIFPLLPRFSRGAALSLQVLKDLLYP